MNPWADLLGELLPVPTSTARLVHFDGGETGGVLSNKISAAMNRREKQKHYRECARRKAAGLSVLNYLEGKKP